MKQQAYRLGYRADLEGLRAVAILLVVAVHAGVPWFTGGFVGVDVFFVLSGFLITGLLVRETTTTGKLRFARFYVRRLRRLLPALFLMLIVVGVLGALLLAPARQLAQSTSGTMAALWLSNVHFAFAHLNYFASGARTNLFLHTWSLGVEEQFYLIWPALLVFLLGRDHARGVARAKAGMWVVVAASFVACVILTFIAPRWAFYLMPLRAWQFGAGALLWLYFMVPEHDAPARLTRYRQPVGWLGLALVVFASVWLRGDMPYPGDLALLPTLGAVAIIAAGCTAAPATGVTRLLSWRPLQWIGHVSYSWYLWHWPVLLLGAALVGSRAPAYRVLWVIVSLLLAWASYVLVESPIRRQRYWVTRPVVTIAGTAALMVCASMACMFWHGRAARQMGSPALRNVVDARTDKPAIYAMGCDDWYHSARVRLCGFGDRHASHTAVLIGDSHAGQWFPAAERVFARPGWRLIVATKSSCPMVDEPYFYDRIGREYSVCATWRAHALADIAALKPDIVLVASAVTHFTRTQWVDGTTKVLATLSPAAGHVYLFRDTPELPFNGPDCLARQVDRPAWLKWPHACAAPLRDQQSRRVYGWLQVAAARFPNVDMIDMNAYICPDGECAAMRHGIVVFRDSQHLTRDYAGALAPVLARKLRMRFSGKHVVNEPYWSITP